ncbi:MAG: hypothetical protein KQH63_11800 [Desulfobulbaceae bacterium]|nr:hypothetical protein [Desulfobulbaceae bacterium]
MKGGFSLSPHPLKKRFLIIYHSFILVETDMGAWKSQMPNVYAQLKKNTELKKIVAELTLDNRMLKDVVSKNW